MTDSFNLIDSPWIRVRDHAGLIREVGLREALTHAHEFDRLAGELDTQDFAVLRILLAVLDRAVSPGPDDDPFDLWESLATTPGLPTDRIDAYLGQWRDRFDLLDAERPFLQVPDLHNAKGEWRSLELLVPDCPQGGSLFRRRDPERPLPLGDAARWLVHCQAYDTSGIKSGAVGDERVKGGKGYPTPVGWAGWMGGQYVLGSDLKQTLLFNLVLDRPRHEADLPIWEEDQHLTAGERPIGTRGPFGQLGLYTWPERRIRLRVANTEVTEVLICNGDPIPYTRQLTNETMTAWRFSEPQSNKEGAPVYMPRELRESRALWRGIESLLPSPAPTVVKGKWKSQPTGYPSGVVNWVQRLMGHDLIDKSLPLTLCAVGVIYGPQMAVISTILADRLTFRAELLAADTPRLRATVSTAVEAAETAVRALRNLARNLAVAAGGEGEGDADRAEVAAYDELDGAFRSWLLRVGGGVNPDQLLADWVATARSIIIRIGGELVLAVPPGAWRGRESNGHVVSVGTAQAWFRAALAKALPAPSDATGPQPESTIVNQEILT